MEFNNNRRSPFESSAAESSGAEDDDDTKKSKSRKKAKNQSAEESKSEGKKQAVAEKLGRSSSTIWERLIGEKETAKAEKSDESAQLTKPEAAETAEEDEAAAPLDELGPEEQRVIVSAYIAERQAQVQQAYEQAIEQGDDMLAAELAVDAAMLEAMQVELAGNPDDAPEEAVEAAFVQTAQEVMGESVLSAEVTPDDADKAAAAIGGSSAAPIIGGGPTVTIPSIFGTPAAPDSPLRSGRARSAANPNMANQPPTVIEQHGGSALLVGGIVGYLLGRRRGRINTEKRLGAVQKKLEQKVEAAQAQVFKSEQKIRSLVRERQPVQSSARIERAVSSEAAPRVPSEHLGLVSLKAAERPPVTEPPRRIERAIPAQEMQREELLAVSNVIRVGETNLRRVYETRLISEQGLRRLVEVHQKGGDVRRELDRELVEKERSYELDPRMRNRAAAPIDSVGGAANVNATLVAALGAQSAAAYTARRSEQASLANPEAKEAARKKQQIDLAVAGGLVLLVVIVVLIYMVLTS